MSAFSSSPSAAPPYSAGHVVLTRPISQACLNTCIGNFESRSHSAAMGMICSLVNRRAVSMSAFCSSDSWKSIMRSSAQLARPVKTCFTCSTVSTKGSFFRPAIQRMHGYVPGEQPRDRRYIKLNTNENPYPPSPRVLEALAAAIGGDLRLYPDPDATELRAKAAEVYGVPADRIIAGNGSDDLLSMLFRACVENSDGDVAYAVPTYSLYDTLAKIQGVTPKTVGYPPDFAVPVEALA